MTLRLDEAVAAGKNCWRRTAAPDGWEWLDFERLTGEDGQAVRPLPYGFLLALCGTVPDGSRSGRELIWQTYVTRHGGSRDVPAEL